MSADRDAQPIELQQSFWDNWNRQHRETSVGEVSSDQQKVVLAWLTDIGRTDLNIIDVGCGSGWLDPSLKQFGAVTATDLSADVLARTRTRIPHVEFIAGDFMELPFEAASYDVAVSLEVFWRTSPIKAPSFPRSILCCARAAGSCLPRRTGPYSSGTT